MGKKMSKAGAELRRAIRADIDASPSIDHLELRRKHKAAEGIVASAMTKTVAEWDAVIAAIPDSAPAAKKEAHERRVSMTAEHPAEVPEEHEDGEPTALPAMSGLGIEQGFVKFARKPAKLGDDYIFWTPRVYIKNGLVDPKVEYDVYLRKRGK